MGYFRGPTQEKARKRENRGSQENQESQENHERHEGHENYANDENQENQENHANDENQETQETQENQESQGTHGKPLIALERRPVAKSTSRFINRYGLLPGYPRLVTVGFPLYSFVSSAARSSLSDATPPPTPSVKTIFP